MSKKKSKYKVKVKRSDSGLGLFAEELIPKGEFIVEYFGAYLSEEQADQKGGKYLFEIETDLVIDGSSRKNVARYINHSCKPNCETVIEGKRIHIYSKRKIKAGEELNYNYGKEYYKDMIKPFGCRCGHH